MKILPGLKTVRLLGVKKTPGNRGVEEADDKQVSHYSKMMSHSKVIEESRKEEADLKKQVKLFQVEISSSSDKLKNLLKADKVEDYAEQIKILHAEWKTIKQSPVSSQEDIHNKLDGIRNAIREAKYSRYQAFTQIQEIRQNLKQLRQDLYYKRMALIRKTKDMSTPLQDPEQENDRKTIVKYGHCYNKVENLLLPTERNLEEDLLFSGTDNGIINMTETVSFNINRFSHRLKLFNYFSPLHDSSTSLEDEIFNPPDEEYLELPKQGVSIAFVDIDVGTGQMRARQKLEKKKASTTQGKVVTSIEKDWSQSSIQNTRSATDILRIYDSQCQQRTSLRDFITLINMSVPN
jgi:predicted  nucleic acid-binding Zn-ribbon protein